MQKTFIQRDTSQKTVRGLLRQFSPKYDENYARGPNIASQVAAFSFFLLCDAHVKLSTYEATRKSRPTGGWKKESKHVNVTQKYLIIRNCIKTVPFITYDRKYYCNAQFFLRSRNLEFSLSSKTTTKFVAFRSVSSFSLAHKNIPSYNGSCRTCKKNDRFVEKCRWRVQDLKEKETKNPSYKGIFSSPLASCNNNPFGAKKQKLEWVSPDRPTLLLLMMVASCNRR